MVISRMTGRRVGWLPCIRVKVMLLIADHTSSSSSSMFIVCFFHASTAQTFHQKSFMSLVTHCNHVFLPLPLPTFPSTSTFVHFLTQSSSAFLSTCPNHLNLPRLTILFFRVTPHIHLTIIFS